MEQNAPHPEVEARLNEVQNAKEQAAKAMAMALEAAEWREKSGRTIRRLKKQLRRLQEDASALTCLDLLDILNVPAETPLEDFRKIHRACQSIDPSDAQIARGIVEAASFEQWLSTDDSAALFIEDGSALTFKGRFTSLSLMSSLVIEALQNQDPAKSIQNFCGRHISWRDPLTGPQGMMRSLICQVLRLFQNEVKLGFTSPQRYREELESHRLRTLCDCFANIVKQLPADIVLFCIVDGIDCFEKIEWADDCRLMIREIQDILHEDEYGPVFKLLVTSPVRSRYVGDTFNSQYRLLLSDDGSRGRNNPTESEISMGARRPKPRKSNALRTSKHVSPAEKEHSSEECLSDSDFSWGSDHE